jgi:hypothetical protein
VRRAGWPDFGAFDVAAYPAAQRRQAAHEWVRRARLEHASVHQFTQVSHVLCEARVPLEVLGALSRLIADEVRHSELEWQMAHACYPEGEREDGFFAWPRPRTPWAAPPLVDAASGAGPDANVEPLLRWAADAVIGACCIGETVSVSTLEALATVTTEPASEAVFRQILRDEHLHATFGFETLALLWPRLGAPSRRWLEAELAVHLAAFERGVAEGISLAELVDQPLEIHPGDPARPNLGLMPRRHYALIYYATVESEVLPRLEAIGLRAFAAWAARPAWR